MANTPTPLKSDDEVSNLHYILTCHNKEDNLIINFAVQPEKKNISLISFYDPKSKKKSNYNMDEDIVSWQKEIVVIKRIPPEYLIYTFLVFDLDKMTLSVSEHDPKKNEKPITKFYDCFSTFKK